MLRYWHFWGADIPMFNLMIGIGVALGMLYLQYNPKFKAWEENDRQAVHIGLFIALVAGVIGAVALDAYTQGIPLRISNLKQMGLTLWGGLGTGLLSLTIYLKIKALPFPDTLNMLVPSVCIAHAFGRLGCFCAGCCFGCPTTSGLGVVFPEGSLPCLHYGGAVSVLPTQLFESGFVVLLFFFFIFSHSVVVRRNRWLIYLSAYSAFRFCLEYWRADDRGVLFSQGSFSPSQIISLVVLILTIPWLIGRLTITRRLAD